MLPDGAEDRLLASANIIADACRASGVQQWDLVGFQSYGQQLDIEAGKITMAAGGGEGGFGVRWSTAADLVSHTSWMSQVQPVPWNKP